MNINNNIKTYRFKLDNNLINLIQNFAEIHQYDDRKIFKEFWEEWLETNQEIILQESIRLKDLNYKGNLNDKLYRSARYYFRNKCLETKHDRDSDINNINDKKRDYIMINSNIINIIDDHINYNIKNNDFTPASGFLLFYDSNIKILDNEFNRLANDNTDYKKKDFYNKIKKTYKNRYFLYSKYQSYI